MIDTKLTAFERDSLRWRGRVLDGQFAHWCEDWDGLPVDETTCEWPCPCAPHLGGMLVVKQCACVGCED